MYEDFVKRLRERATWINFPRHGEEYPTEDAKLMMDAADAIDELDTLLDGVEADNDALCETIERLKKPRWIPVTEDTPSDFVSVQARMTDAGVFPSVREAYVVNKNWFFPALKEFHPVDMWKRFDEPPKEET